MPQQVTDWTPAGELKPVGTVVLVVVDIQGTDSASFADSLPGDIEFMAERTERSRAAVPFVEAFRARGVPVVFIQEVHKPSLIDIGRELDGNEGPHCVEGDPRTELYPGLQPRDDEYLIKKRRYSAFFGTELDIVLRGYKADTIVLIGGMTDVCVHYTAVDAHQHDYTFRTVSDLVAGSGVELHDAALRAMKYLQRDALVTSASVYAWLETLPVPDSERPEL